MNQEKDNLTPVDPIKTFEGEGNNLGTEYLVPTIVQTHEGESFAEEILELVNDKPKPIISYFSTTAKTKPISEEIMRHPLVQVPSKGNPLPHIATIYDYFADRLHEVGMGFKPIIYASSAIAGKTNNKDEEFAMKNGVVWVDRWQLEFLLNVDVHNDEGSESTLKIVSTFNYNEGSKLMVNVAFAEYIKVCKNGLIIEKNVLEENSAFTKKKGLEQFVKVFLTNDQFSDAIRNLQIFKANMSDVIDTQTENKIIGQMLKEKIVDLNILKRAAEYADNPDNEFKAISGLRTKWDFMQDFTKFMDTTEISSHIKKHKKIADFIENIEVSKLQ